MNILAVGDVHRSFGDFNMFLNKTHPDIVLQCGDFGYWPREPISEIYGRNNPRYPKKRPAPKVPEGTAVCWCDGNHEDHESLALRETDEIWPNVHYMPRGSILELPDGRRVMFFGGAASIDRSSRKLGIDWFPEEAICDADIRDMAYEGPVDIVISHTCPKEFPINMRKNFGYFNDSSRLALSYVLDHYRPSLWYFGHWHHYMTGYTKDCRWSGLDYVGSGGRFWETVRQ
jgi:hypothetical protein